MNTYSKYVPNVWLAKCTEKHEHGAIIPVANKYGKENDSIVYNLISEKDGFFYYSIVRADGFNVQEYAKKKAERSQNAALNSEKKSDEYYNKSHNATDGIPFGQPILIGHHSERKHRNAIEKACNNMDKCVEFSDKAKEQESRAGYWKSRENIINLSMPESIDFYKYQIENAKAKHEGLKNGTIEKSHSFSLTYAKKELNDCKSKLKTAFKLWGDVEIKKDLIPKTKSLKEYSEEKQTELFKNTGSFFAFSTDQFREQKKEGVKYTHLGAGLICPTDKIQDFKQGFDELTKQAIKQDIEDNGKENIIKRELYNYECFYISDISEAVKALKKYKFSNEEIQAVYNSEYKRATA